MGHSGMVHFHSQTLMEDIEATLTDMTGIMDAVDGSFAFQVKMRSFSFAKALMQEHFKIVGEVILRVENSIRIL